MLSLNYPQGISVLIAEDHPLYADGLAQLINNLPGITFVDKASNGLEALSFLRQKTYHLLLLDIRMQPMDGEQMLKEFAKLDVIKPKIIVISSSNDGYTVAKVSSLGIDGYLLKDENARDMMRAFELVLHGGQYYSQNVINKRFLPSFNEEQSCKKLLSNRELKILLLICQGFTNLAIAKALNISENTVMRHKQNIRIKTGITTLTGFVSFAIKHNLVDVDDL